jgi:hypothetical protein
MERLGLDFTKGNGEIVSLTNASEQLKDRLGKLSAEQRITALNTLFGSDATRAATVLMHEGAGGIREFISATKDQNAAQEMAEARMGGTAGALERLSGSVETAKLRLGQELAPAVEVVANWLSEQLVPAMDGAIDAAKDVGKGIAPLVDTLASFGGTAAEAAGKIGGLPDPIKSVGIQAGIAAIALPKLKGALGSVSTSTGGFLTSMRNAESRTRTLGATAKNVAGVGGILLLASSFRDAAEDGASFGDVMKGAAGGAGIGAMFGPVGALVGAGVGGGLTALTGAFAETEEEARAARLELLRTQGFENAKEDANSLRTALQGVINAYGKTARAAVEASFTGDDGKLDADIARLRSLGVSMDTITSASMGNAQAQKLVNDALAQSATQAEVNRSRYKRMWDDAQDGMREWTDYYGNVHREKLSSDEIDELGRKYRYWDEQVKSGSAAAEVFGRRIEENTGVISEHSKQMRELARDLNIPLQRYKQFPQAVRTRFEAEGIVQTASDAIRLIREYKGLQSFDRIKAIISAPGVDLTRQQVVDLQKKYDLTPEQVKTLFRIEGIGEAVGALTSGINTAEGRARSGGVEIGSALKSGISSGFAGAASQLAADAANAVDAAIRTAKQHADAHSPSRKMRQIGEWMGEGLVEGMTRHERNAAEAGRRLADAALVGSGGRRFAAASVGGAAAARSQRGRGPTISEGHRYTFVIEGQPFTAIARREIADDRRWSRRLDDRD